MILDLEAILSNDQAITGTEDSDFTIELPKRSYEGTPMRVLIQVTETFVGGTSVAIDLETDDADTFNSPTDIANIAAIAVGTLVAGYKINIPFMPRNNEEFIRLEYTVIGNPSEGQFTAGIIFDEQTNKSTFPPA